eukprot:m.485923 g.485923  ORF g.485923 m.485923 type:complete len:203 (+) comp24070_c0_seq1:347-955(+)
MKFRFCGEQDCPDWLLAEVVLLAKVSSIKVKILAGAVVKNILGEQLNFDKVSSALEKANLDQPEIKAAVACLLFILTSAAKHDCEAETLSNELQQLGLPKEHASSLAKVYGDKIAGIQTVLRQQSLRLWKLEACDWRVDYVLASSKLETVQEPEVQLSLKVKSPEAKQPKTTSFVVATDKFRMLLADLKLAEAQMAQLEGAN